MILKLKDFIIFKENYNNNLSQSKIFYHLTTANSINDFIEQGYIILNDKNSSSYFGKGWYFFEDLDYKNLPMRREYKFLLKCQLDMEKVFILDDNIQKEMRNKTYKNLEEQLYELSPNTNIDPTNNINYELLGGKFNKNFNSFNSYHGKQNPFFRGSPFDGQTGASRELHNFLKLDKNIKGLCFWHGYHENIVAVVYDPSIINIIEYNSDLKGNSEWIPVEHGDLKFIYQ